MTSDTATGAVVLVGCGRLGSAILGGWLASATVTPADLQVRRIGHFGFFRDQFRQSLWPRAAAALAALGGGVHHGEVSGTTA